VNSQKLSFVISNICRKRLVTMVNATVCVLGLMFIIKIVHWVQYKKKN